MAIAPANPLAPLPAAPLRLPGAPLLPAPVAGPRPLPPSGRLSALDAADHLLAAPGGPVVNGRWTGAGPAPSNQPAPPPIFSNPGLSAHLPPPPGAGSGFARPDLPPGALIGRRPYGPLPPPVPPLPGSYLLSPTPAAPLNWMWLGGMNTLQYGFWLRDGGMPIYNTPIPPIAHPSISAR